MIVGCVAVLLLFVLYVQPEVIGAASATTLGRGVVVIAAALGAMVRPVIGVLVVAAYVVASSSSPDREAFTAVPGKPSGVPRFRSENCVSTGNKERGLVGAGGTLLNSDEVKSEFPRVRFAADACNPCESDCEFDLLAIEEGFRANRGGAAPNIGLVPPPLIGSWLEQHGLQSSGRPNNVKPLPKIAM